MAEMVSPAKEQPTQPYRVSTAQLLRLWKEAGRDPIKFAEKLKEEVPRCG